MKRAISSRKVPLFPSVHGWSTPGMSSATRSAPSAERAPTLQVFGVRSTTWSAIHAHAHARERLVRPGAVERSLLPAPCSRAWSAWSRLPYVDAPARTHSSTTHSFGCVATAATPLKMCTRRKCPPGPFACPHRLPSHLPSPLSPKWPHALPPIANRPGHTPLPLPMGAPQIVDK